MGQLTGIARRSARRAVMEEVGSASVSIQFGIDGDYRGEMRGRQVTILASQDWQAACSDVGTDLPWTTRRANLLIDGVVLPRTAWRPCPRSGTAFWKSRAKQIPVNAWMSSTMACGRR